MAEPTRKPKKQEPQRTVVLVDAQGVEEELEIRNATEKVVFVQKIVPDIREITVKGVQIEVDLKALEKMNPESQMHGVPVSVLIAAAEIA